MNIVERFLKYVSFTTTSDEKTEMTPSTPGQMIFAQSLANELKSIGLEDVEVDKNGYVMATLPANCTESLPTIGFIAHLDTSPDMSGRHVKARVVQNYDGKDILLNEEENILLSTVNFPEIEQYKGQDIIVTNGKTLLGADDKAGIAEIVTALEYLIQHPDEKHGKIRVAFTPDEEIGQGADHFDVQKFGANWAYTIDGGEIGELEYENFNAALAKVSFFGRNVHPGYAKHKMLNSIRIAHQFTSMLPRHETPEHTEGYEGFYHLISIDGNVEKTTMNYIIRDHDRDRFERRKKEFQHLVNKIVAEFGKNAATLEIEDQYYNMREKIEPVKHIVDLAFRAMEEVGVEPKIRPIRGGTDGAKLSFKGLPCPNVFTGGHNFHGRYEYIPIPSMEKAMQVIVKIATLNSLSK
ncbi:MAG: peptidase T [Paludibacteraceae bacterium]|nr:peptidase T [Paludibacteraceae bacterium]MBO7724131.1 peptidase T [Paludibacteraceae bacterium]